MSKYIYNQKKDSKDLRDYLFSSKYHIVSSADLPSSFHLESTGCVPKILDQGSLGSCGSSQISNALRFCLKKQKDKEFQPSRIFNYFFTRVLENSPIDEDTGVTIRGSLKSIRKHGVCSENNLGYDVSKFHVNPNEICVKAAKQHIKGFQFLNVAQNIVSIKQALLHGPVIIGIQIYDSFERNETLKTGNVPIPNTSSETRLGGHCVALYGWNDDLKVFDTMNTWGCSVGRNGWFSLPYDYVLNPKLSSDFWYVTYFK